MRRLHRRRKRDTSYLWALVAAATSNASRDDRAVLLVFSTQFPRYTTAARSSAPTGSAAGSFRDRVPPTAKQATSPVPLANGDRNRKRTKANSEVLDTGDHVKPIAKTDVINTHRSEQMYVDDCPNACT